MRASTQQQRCVAIVDPISTGACVAVEATKRGYAVVAVWSAMVTKDLRNMVPEHAKGLRYHAQVDEGESIEATAQLLRKAAAPYKVDAVICGAEVRHATPAARLPLAPPHQASMCMAPPLTPSRARLSQTGVEVADRLSQRSGLASNGTELGNRRDKHTQQQASRLACLPTLLPLHRRPRPILPPSSGGTRSRHARRARDARHRVADGRWLGRLGARGKRQGGAASS